jgi:PAS domain S-box-containing protein
MNPIAFTLVLSAIANLGYLAWVFWHRHSRPSHLLFAATVLALAAWNLTNVFLLVVDRPDLNILVGRTAFALGVAICSLYLAFTWQFPENCHPRPSRRLVWLVFGSGMLVLLLCFTPLVQAAISRTAFGNRPVFGPCFPAYVLYLVGAIVGSTYNMLKSRRRAQNARQRMQIEYCLAGFALAFLTVFVTQFMMQIYAARPDYAFVGGGVASLMITSMTSYAVVRYRFMDIGIALRTVVILGLMSLILGAFFFVPLVIQPHFLSGASPLLNGLVSLILAMLASLIIAPLHRRVTSFVDQRIFRGRYDHNAALMRFGDRLLGTYGLEGVAGVVAEEVPIILQANGCAVYLFEEDGTGCLLYGASGGDGEGPPDRIDPNSPILKAVTAVPRSIVKDEVEYSPAYASYEPGEMVRQLAQLGMSVATLLTSKGKTLGMILLGEKNKDNVYTSDDIKLLKALGSQAAIALDNMRLYGQIMQTEKHYATILKHMQRGVLTVDVNLQVVTLNDKGAEILKMPVGAWIGNNLQALLPRFASLAKRTLEQRRDLPPLETTLSLNEYRFPCECETSLLLDVRNEPKGVLVVFQDLTEKKQFEEEVRRIDRLASVGTLAAGVAHEIKNPLVSIQTFAELLPERYTEAEFREGFGSVVVSEIGRINNLVHDLLDFARPRHVQSGKIQVASLAQKALLLLQSEFRNLKIELVQDYGEEASEIYGDPEQLHQVFLNLLQNALHAMEGAPGRISICSSKGKMMDDSGKARDAVVLKLADTGQGIEEKDLPQVFDPFFSTKDTGSGLGLAICHSILKEHGAKIDVESRRGEGTVFVMTFPLWQNNGGC